MQKQSQPAISGYEIVKQVEERQNKMAVRKLGFGSLTAPSMYVRC